MRAGKILGMSWENLTQRKLRTSLTTLGVVIGIAAIVGLASLGEGFRVEIRERIEQGFELDVLIVIPGSFTAALRQPFTLQEINSVRNVTGVKLAAPLITLPQAKVYNGTNQKINAFTLAAVNFSEMAQMMGERFIPIEGEIPSESENDTIVLGYKACFLNETTRLAKIGDNVTMQLELQTQFGSINVSKTLRVAAILGKSGTAGITNFDNWAFIPTQTAVELMGTEAYNIILVKVSNIEQSEQIADDIEDVFDNPYSISVLVPIAFVHQVDRILAVVQLFLMAIASISLLVAGIGIMNIMTVSVMERTREIGILKAIGAKSRTVLEMFLSEAVLIGIIGGLIGILTGYGLSFALSYGLSNFIQPQQADATFGTSDLQRMSINPVFSLEWTIIALVFAVIVCIIFGLYPARKASKLNPVDALRYE